MYHDINTALQNFISQIKKKKNTLPCVSTNSPARTATRRIITENLMAATSGGSVELMLLLRPWAFYIKPSSKGKKMIY